MMGEGLMRMCGEEKAGETSTILIADFLTVANYRKWGFVRPSDSLRVRGIERRPGVRDDSFFPE